MAQWNPPVCECFGNFGVGGYCFKNLTGCSKAAKKQAQPKKRTLKSSAAPKPKSNTIRVNGQDQEVPRADIRTWVNPVNE